MKRVNNLVKVTGKQWMQMAQHRGEWRALEETNAHHTTVEEKKRD